MLTSRPKSTSNYVHTQVLDCPVAFIGEPAFDLLPRRGLAGTVIACFSRSRWLETTGGRVFAVADRRSGEGPLTVGVALPDGVALDQLGVNEGAELVADGVDFQLGSSVILRMAEVSLWRPVLLGPRASNDEVTRRLWALIDSVTSDAPAEGLAPLLGHLDQLVYGSVPLDPDFGIVPRMAAPSVALLAEGIAHGDRDAVDQAMGGLIGLGPGLTPSGDDMLGGLMVALRTALGTVSCDEAPLPTPSQSSSVPVIDELSASILRHSSLTNRISAALLEHAALGVGSATQHRVVQCLHEVTPDTDIETAVAKLVRWGNTSGWDSLTGILLGTALALRLAESPSADSGQTPTHGELVEPPEGRGTGLMLKNHVLKNVYRDSVVLMRLSREMESIEGVSQATAHNGHRQQQGAAAASGPSER